MTMIQAKRRSNSRCFETLPSRRILTTAISSASSRGRVHGIYGDRGVENYESRISDLCLDEDVEQRIQFHFVKDACHMPMVENPEGLAAIVRQITKLPE